MLQFFALWLFVIQFTFTGSRGQDQNLKDVKFIFVNGSNPKEFKLFALNDTSSLLNDPSFDNNRPTMLYGYGYTERYNSSSVQKIVEAYIERADHNILVIDYYSGGNYFFEAIPNTHKVGDLLGRKLLEMKRSGFNIEGFHLIGHSLGAHLVAFIGRSVNAHSNKTEEVRRITALDPAGPFFYGVGQRLNRPMKKEDGRFVDIIHTDHTFFGAPVQTGTADFWPNGGKDQPSCPPPNWDIYSDENFCSHRRSWAFWIESIRMRKVRSFNAVSCQSWKNFTENTCEDQTNAIDAFMGIDADPRLTGNFFLQTNAAAPFSRDDTGTTYKAVSKVKASENEPMPIIIN